MKVGVGLNGFLQPGKCNLEHEIRATGDGCSLIVSCFADLEVCGCNEYLACDCVGFSRLL